MTAATRSAKNQQSPLPPAGGWMPMQAAEALCPREAELYCGGGASLKRAVLADSDEAERWFLQTGKGMDAAAERWLSKHLLTALSERPDLRLTGTNLALGIQEPRVTLRHDLLVQAVGNQNANQRYTMSVDLGVSAETARITTQFVGWYDPDVHEQYPAIPEPVELVAVRIEVVEDLRSRAGTSAMPLQKTAPVERPRYTFDACRSWLRQRVATWPDGIPPPSREDCLAAARAHFADPIPRDAFYAVRRGVVPPEWQKPGPRGPRKPA